MFDPQAAAAMIGLLAFAALVFVAVAICVVTVSPVRPRKRPSLTVVHGGRPDYTDLKARRLQRPQQGLKDEPCVFDGTGGFISTVKCAKCGFDMYRPDGYCVWCGSKRAAEAADTPAGAPPSARR